MAKTLILGGNGFIGSHLVNKCIERGDDIAIASYQRSSNNALQFDIRSAKQVRDHLKGQKFDRVFNLSGYIDHTSFSNGGRIVLDQHFLGVQNVIENLDWNHLQSFVQVGSSDEYGNAESPIEETTREAPIAPYSLGKTATTHFLQMLHKTESFPAVIVRFFLVYGPGQDQRRFIPQIIKGCLGNETFKASEGNQLRDFCYIDDIVDGLILASESQMALGHVINLASGQPVKVKSVVEKIVDACGGGKPQFGEIPYRKGESMSLYANVEKAKKILGWTPKTRLEEGLQKTIQSFQKVGVNSGT